MTPFLYFGIFSRGGPRTTSTPSIEFLGGPTQTGGSLLLSPLIWSMGDLFMQEFEVWK